MKAAALTYHRAESLPHAIELVRRYDGTAKVMAGGQSLLPMMNLRMTVAEHVIDISGIKDLKSCYFSNDKYFVGAGVTHAMIEDGQVEDPTRGYLRHVASGIAYRSIRNRGTVGGSLAHADPAADWPAALLALNSSIVLEGAEGEREISLADFQIGLMETALQPGEVLKGVLVPRLSERARWAYVKFQRKVGEFAHSIGAAVVDPSQNISNLVLGAVGGKPARLPLEFKDKDLENAGVEPGTYEFQLHKTILGRALKQVRAQ